MALSRALDPRFAHPVNVIVWFVGGALLHDLAFMPFYLGADIVARFGLREHPRRAMPLVNHVRVPAVMAGTMFLVFLPLILQRAPATYLRDSGHAPPHYLLRWALVSAGLFAAAAAVYALRRLAARRRGGAAARHRSSPRVRHLWGCLNPNVPNPWQRRWCTWVLQSSGCRRLTTASP